MSRLFAILPACLLLAAPAVAQPLNGAGSPPELGQALVQAYLYNPQLAAERKLLRQTDEGVPRALSGWRPTISFTTAAGAAAVFDNLDPKHSPERRVPQNENLQLSQPLYTGGRVGAQVKQADALVAAERAALRAQEASTLLAAATAYLDVARDLRTVELNQNQENVLERTLRATEQQLVAGSVTATDVSQSRARFDDQVAALAAAVTSLDLSRAEFEQVIGQQPGTTPMPTLMLNLPPRLDAALGLIEDNFQVAQARANLEASRQGIDIARAGLLPQLFVEVRGTHLAETDTQRAHEHDVVAEGGIMLTIPIYQGGDQAAQIRQAQEAASRSNLLIDVTRRQAVDQVKAAWARVQGARRRIDAYQRSLSANVIAERGVSRQQSVGARTALDVLNAQQERLAAEVNLVAAQHDDLVAGFTLQSAIGRLSAADLGLQAPIYDPTVHYSETRDRWYGTTPAP